MRLKLAVLVCLALLAPVLAAPVLAEGCHEQSAMSCAAGMQWNAGTKTCEPVSS